MAARAKVTPEERQFWVRFRQALLLAVSAIEQLRLDAEVTTTDMRWWFDLRGHRQADALAFIAEKRHNKQ